MDDHELEFQKIYDDFYPKILCYLARLVGEQEAEDLTQEVFVKVNRALEDFRGECKLSTWLYRIATNAALDKLRSPSFQQRTLNQLSYDSLEESEAEIDDREAWREEETPSVEQQVMRNERVQCFGNFVEHLPVNYRTVVVLGELEGLTNHEMAEILGLSLNGVKIRLHRGRARLLQELKAYCKAEDWL